MQIRAYAAYITDDGGCNCCRERRDVTVIQLNFTDAYGVMAGNAAVSIRLCPKHLKQAKAEIDRVVESL